MTDKEIIARQAEKIIMLEDKLAEANDVKNHWFNVARNSIKTEPLSFEETIHMLSCADIPSALKIRKVEIL
nr:hypothetical protein [uncultured Caproiciproducens sp.]